MTANVETMAYNAENGVPWHKVGNPVNGAADKETMQREAGLLWTVNKQPLFTYGLGDQSSTLLAVTDRVAMVRSSDNKVLGTVGATYQPIQNDELFTFADALVGTGAGVKFETAGSLNGGRVVFAQAVIPEKAIKIDGDPQGEVMPYLILASGHDGLRAMQATFTPVRVVCSNTLAMALKGAAHVFSIRHTVNSGDRIADAYKALRVNVEYLEEVRKVSQQLIKVKMSRKDVLAGLEVLIPSMSETPEKAVKAQKQRDDIFTLYTASPNLDGVPESAYRFVQAVAEWADHERPYRATKKGSADDARALAVLDGTASTYKTNALRLVLPAAAVRGPGGRFAKVG